MGKPRQPSVEEVPDDSDRVQRQMARQSALDESLHPSRASSIPPHVSTTSAQAAPSPAPAPSGQAMDVDTEQDPGLSLPSAPETISPPPSVPHLPNTPGMPNLRGPVHPSHPPDSFQSFPSPSTMPPSSPPARSFDPTSFYNPPTAPAEPGPRPTPPNPVAPSQMPQPARTSVQPAASAGQTNSQAVDDQAIGLAQKHARWAVSALTFDDVNTAVNELRNSLRYLGAE